MPSSICRFDDFPRKPWITALSPRWFSAYSNRFTCRTLSPNSSAAACCVITRFFAFFNITNRSRSPGFINSCPSSISQAWSCQGDISTLLKGDIITLLPQQHSLTIDGNRHLDENELKEQCRSLRALCGASHGG